MERDIEHKLVHNLKNVGCKALKYSCQNEAGYPDRLVLTPKGTAFWVEVKQPGAYLRPLQKARKAELERMGFSVFVCKTDFDIKMICEYACAH